MIIISTPFSKFVIMIRLPFLLNPACSSYLTTLAGWFAI